MSRNAWKGISIAVAIGLVIVLMTAGLLIPLIAVILILVILGGGALLYRVAGPPER